MNRRTLLKGVAIGTTSTVLSQLPETQLFAQAAGGTSATAPKVSAFLLALMQRKVAATVNSIRLQKAHINATAPQVVASRPQDLQSAITSLEAWFGNLQETGWNDWFNQQVKSGASQIVSSDLSPYLSQLLQGLASQGVTLTQAQIQSLFIIVTDAVSSVINQVVNEGIASLEADLLAALAGRQPGPGPLFRPTCANLGFTFGIIGIFATFFLSGPIGIGFAMAAVLYDGAGLAGDC